MISRKGFEDLAGHALSENDVQRLLFFIRYVENESSLEGLFSILGRKKRIIVETGLRIRTLTFSVIYGSD